MSKEVLILVDAIAREKNVEREIVFESLESALASATKKRFPHESDIVVRIDRSNGEYDAFRRWKVVEDDEFTNDESEITLFGFDLNCSAICQFAKRSLRFSSNIDLICNGELS